MRMIRGTFAVIPLDEQILNQAIDADMKDFEDAVQFHSALRAGADCLVTRNPKHFPMGYVPVQTPAEFLATYTAQ